VPLTDMTSDAYKLISRKVGRLCTVTFFVVSVPVLGIVLFVADRVSGLVSFDRGWVFLLATPFACSAFALGALSMEAIDRRVGLRCSKCSRSITLRCDPRKIVTSGVCPNCHISLFDVA
jgi:hypothetical protein